MSTIYIDPEIAIYAATAGAAFAATVIAIPGSRRNNHGPPHLVRQRTPIPLLPREKVGRPQMALIFDIETDGLLDDCTKIHCLCIQDEQTGKTYSCADQPGYTPIREGLRLLAEAETIIGHNIIKFDLPAIRKIYPGWETRAQIRDTLLCTRLIWPDIADADYARIKAKKQFPARLIGRHSLEAWGWRIRDHKGDFGKTTDWKQWCKEMQDYCEQDVVVTAAL